LLIVTGRITEIKKVLAVLLMQ